MGALLVLFLYLFVQINNEMPLDKGLLLAYDFDIIPDVCNHRQFRELWKLVNRSEAYV